MKDKLICGVGVTDIKMKDENGKQLKSYSTWHQMLTRCYDPKWQEKKPTYRGCTVAEEWHRFSNFKVWYDLNYRTGFQLDKDLLIQNNKVYGPSTCRFVSNQINSLFLDCGAARGELPMGVSQTKSGKYRVRCNSGGKNNHIGLYSTIQEAVEAYRSAKKDWIKKVADEALNNGEIEFDLYQSIINRRLTR